MNLYTNYKEKLKPTPSDIEGPFYLPGAPFRNKLTENPELTISGKVYNISGDILKNAILDFWQADPKGVYDEKGYEFRGKVAAEGGGGEYRLETVRPGDYKISDTEYRCSHIHVKVSCIGYKTLTTQLYFKDDKYNSTDHWFNPVMVIPDNGKFDFVLEN